MRVVVIAYDGTNKRAAVNMPNRDSEESGTRLSTVIIVVIEQLLKVNNAYTTQPTRNRLENILKTHDGCKTLNGIRFY